MARLKNSVENIKELKIRVPLFHALIVMVYCYLFSISIRKYEMSQEAILTNILFSKGVPNYFDINQKDQSTTKNQHSITVISLLYLYGIFPPLISVWNPPVNEIMILIIGIGS